MVPLCFSILRSSHAAMFEKNLRRLLRIQSRMARIKRRMNGTGNRFPAILKNAVCHQGIPSPQPKGIAPRHSMMGSIEQKNTQSSRPTVSRKNLSIASIIVYQKITEPLRVPRYPLQSSIPRWWELRAYEPWSWE